MAQNDDTKAVIAAGGIVSRYNDGEEILLIFRNGHWDLPKGKHEPPESIPMCAVREVAEEVGCAVPAIVQKIGTTYHQYTEEEKKIGKTTHWYSMILTTEEGLTPQREEGITEIKWMPVSEAINKIGYDNLKKLLQEYNEVISGDFR